MQATTKQHRPDGSPLRQRAHLPGERACMHTTLIARGPPALSSKKKEPPSAPPRSHASSCGGAGGGAAGGKAYKIQEPHRAWWRLGGGVLGRADAGALGPRALKGEGDARKHAAREGDAVGRASGDVGDDAGERRGQWHRRAVGCADRRATGPFQKPEVVQNLRPFLPRPRAPPPPSAARRGSGRGRSLASRGDPSRPAGAG